MRRSKIKFNIRPVVWDEAPEKAANKAEAIGNTLRTPMFSGRFALSQEGSQEGLNSGNHSVARSTASARVVSPHGTCISEAECEDVLNSNGSVF